MCSSRKNPYPPQGRSSEIPRGRGPLNAKIVKVKYEAKLEFPEGGVRIFSGTTQSGFMVLHYHAYEWLENMR